MKLSDIYEDGHWVLAKNGKYTSPLIAPGDRERFIKWGKSNRRKKITENVSITPSQGDGYKITTPFGYIEFRPRPEDDLNEIWWVESNKRGHGPELVDLMQKHSPANHIAWGTTSHAGERLRQKWHAAHPDINGGEGHSEPHEGQFDPFQHDEEDEDDII